jgi:hypothetical protein
VRVECVKRGAIVRIQRQRFTNPPRQIGIREEVTAKRDRVGVPFPTMASAVSGSNPPAATILPLNIFRSCCDAIGSWPSWRTIASRLGQRRRILGHASGHGGLDQNG